MSVFLLGNRILIPSRVVLKPSQRSHQTHCEIVTGMEVIGFLYYAQCTCTDLMFVHCMHSEIYNNDINNKKFDIKDSRKDNTHPSSISGSKLAA